MKKKAARKAKTVRSNAMVVSPVERAFDEIVELIRAARQQAVRTVNTELIELYWRIGDYLHRKIESDGWAKGTVVQLAAYIAQREPGLRGFSPQNLWRMRQFFVTYRDDPKLSPLVRVLPWTHNLIVLGSPNAARNASSTCAGRPGALEQARTGTAVPPGRVRARGAPPAKTLTGGETRLRCRRQRLQGRLRGRIPESTR